MPGGRPWSSPSRRRRRILARPTLRRRALRQLSVDAGRLPTAWVLAFVEGSEAATGWPQHYHAAKRARFLGGQVIDVPVHVVWGDADPIAPARTSRHTDQLPEHAIIETWPGCAHQIAWDATDRVVEAALALPTGR